MEYSVQQKFDGFYQIAQEKLQAILYSIPGPYKQLIIDPILIRPLELICGVTWLRSKGINKIYKFDEKTIPITNVESNQNHRQSLTFVYFISCDIPLFKKVIQQIRQINEIQQRHRTQQLNNLNDNMFVEKDFHIISVPTVLGCIEQLVEHEGVYGLIQLHRFNWDFLSLDTGVVSLEIPQIFKEMFIHLDTSFLSSIAHSFRIFNMVFGKASVIITLGEYSEKMLQIVDRIDEASSSATLFGTSSIKSDEKSGDFNMVCVIDRNCDYPSCLITPVVYAGMLLEIYPSHCGRLEIDTTSNLIKKNQLSILAIPPKKTPTTSKNQQPSTSKNQEPKSPPPPPPPHGGDTSHLILNSQRDNLYKENRYKHVSEVLTTFGNQAKLFGVEKSRLKNMQLNEMKDFVEKNLPKISTQKKELLKHLLVCETIINELGDQFERIHAIEQSILINQNRKQSVQLIQEMLAVNPNKLMALRQICLLFVCCSLTNDDAKLFVTNYINAFGHQYLNVFANLSRANLFTDIYGLGHSGGGFNQPSSSSASSPTSTVTANLLNLKKQLNIQKYQSKIEIGVNKFKSRQLFQTSTSSSGGGSGGENAGQSSSYVFSDLYNPLIAQLLTIILKSKKFDEFATASTILSAAAASSAAGTAASTSNTSTCLKFFKYLNLSQQTVQQIGTAIENKTTADVFPFTNFGNLKIFLFIIGGVTHAEIAACQLIGQLTNTTIIIGSNCITSSNDIISDAF